MVRMIIFFQFVSLLWATIFSSDIQPYTINKCCPGDEIISFKNGNLSDYYCAEISQKTSENVSVDYSEYSNEVNVSVNDYYWFPIEYIVNSTTLKIHGNDSEKYLEILKENYQIKDGFFPDCGKNYRREQADLIKGFRELFHPILFDNYSLRIHISLVDTMHDHQNDLEFFKRLNNLNEKEEDFTNFDVGSLRTFPLTDACFDSAEFEGYPFFILFHCPCKHSTCIRKCCADGQFFNVSSNHCEDIPNTINMQHWRPENLEPSDSQHYYLLPSEMPACKDYFPLRKPPAYTRTGSCNSESYNESEDNFTILPNGSVKIPKYKKPYLPDHYCGVTTWYPNGIIYEQNLILCRRKSTNGNSEVQPLRYVLYGTLLILGGICLLITVSVSFYLPELKRRIHNKIALCHNFSLMIAYFAAGIVQFSDLNGTKACLILGLVVQFSFLGSFFWLNVMCIDISMTFSATRSVGDKSSSAFTMKYIYYSIYAWGTTSIISIITITMEFIPNVPYNDLKPGLTCNCGFDNDTSAILIYFYGPMAFTLALNLSLFIFTMIKIMSIQRQTAILHKSESNATGGASYQSDKQRLILYAKLFLLMGLTWVTEIASWAIGGPDYYWYFSDVINLLRAVFIFILFICKKPVLRSLKRKLNGEPLTNRTESSITSASTRRSHSRFSTNSRFNKKKNLVMISMDSRRKQLVAELSSSNLHKMRESRT